MTLKECLSNTMIDNGIEYTISIRIMTGRQSMLGDFKGTEISFKFENEVPCNINPYQLMNVVNKDILDCEVVFRKILDKGECYYIKGTQYRIERDK